MAISRRAVFKTGGIALATGLIGTGDATGRRDRAIPIKIAGGPEGGVYLKFTELLAAAINAAGLGLTCDFEVTEGSVENILLISTGDAHIGLAKADGARDALAGRDPFKSTLPIRALGRVYQDYLQIVVRTGAPLHEMADLNGRKVWLGPPGSGTAMFGKRLLDATGLRVYPQSQLLKDATTLLEKGEIDAMLWMGGVPAPAFAELHDRVGITLLPPAAELLPILRSRYGTVYRQATIPSRSYGTAGMLTVGVANLLVCASTLPDGIAASVTRVLIERAADLVPPEALGTQFLDSRSLISTLGTPMHPGAAAAYRREHG
jgi:uncharacterized protein